MRPYESLTHEQLVQVAKDYEASLERDRGYCSECPQCQAARELVSIAEDTLKTLQDEALARKAAPEVAQRCAMKRNGLQCIKHFSHGHDPDSNCEFV